MPQTLDNICKKLELFNPSIRTSEVFDGFEVRQYDPSFQLCQTTTISRYELLNDNQEVIIETLLKAKEAFNKLRKDYQSLPKDYRWISVDGDMPILEAIIKGYVTIEEVKKCMSNQRDTQSSSDYNGISMSNPQYNIMLGQQANCQSQAMNNQIAAQQNIFVPYGSEVGSAGLGQVVYQGAMNPVIDWDYRVVMDKLTNKKESKTMFGLYGSFKNYVTKHADILFTVVLVMIADKWFFGGALKNSIQGLANKLITKAHDEMDKITSK